MDTEAIKQLNDAVQSVGTNVEFFTMTAGLYITAFCWVPSVFKIKRYGVKTFFLGTFCLIFGLAVPGLLDMWSKSLIDAGNLNATYALLFFFPFLAVVAGFCSCLLPSVIAFKKKANHPRWIMGLNVVTIFIPGWPLWLPLLIWSCWEAHQNIPAPGAPKAKKKRTS